MAMSEEQKKAAAERMKAARAKKKAEEAEKAQAEAKTAEEREDTANAEIEALKKQIAQLQEMLAGAVRPQVVQVAADTEKIHFLWQAQVADDNVVTFGDGGMYGRIVGKTGSFYLPKNDLSRILDSLTRHFLDKRWLIVVDGLTEEEREALGVNYKEGELLDKQAFARMVELGDEILSIYPSLCESHKAMVGISYYEAWKNGNPMITRDRVEELEKQTKRCGSSVKSFTQILDEMAAQRFKEE